MSNVFRGIPSVNELLDSPPLRRLVDRVNRNVVVSGVRAFLDNMRSEVQSAAAEIKIPTPAELAERIAEWIVQEEAQPLRPVINATGVILHTGLGRAPLAEAAIQAVADVCRGHASLEIDLTSGERSERVQAVEKLLRQLTGAEAALVVNNNAAATMLSLAALSDGREAIVSRGELVEIGGSYRLPEIFAASGAVLREVGTTNKTRIADFEAAISAETGALLRVHSSNFCVVGFTERASLAELVALSKRYNVPLLDDIGSGALIDLGKYGIRGEPQAAESIRLGADLVLFSGDKLLGGPQCGVIVGKRALIQKIARHPRARAVRVDKMTLAALAATLRLYRDPELAERSIPVLSLLATPVENLKNRAERLAPQLAACPAISSAETFADVAYLGGGAVPAQQLATWCVALSPAQGSVDGLAAKLRAGLPAVFGRVQQGKVLLDLRSVLPWQDAQIVESVCGATSEERETAAERATEESGSD